MGYTGYFVTVEGNDGTGKSSQIELLKKELVGRYGDKVLFLREPGGCHIGEQVRNVLLLKDNTAMSPICELMLYEAARAQHTEEKILPALRDGKIVICDRFYDSTTVYQGYGRGLDLDTINKLNQIATGGISPNLTLWLEKNPAIPKLHKHGMEDRMDLQEQDFYDRVEMGYRKLYESNSHRIVRIQPGTIEDVHKNIMDTLTSRLDKYFA